MKLSQLTPATVAGWFPDGRVYPRPTAAACEKLTETVGLYAALLTTTNSAALAGQPSPILGVVFEAPKRIDKEATKQLSAISTLAADLNREVERLRRRVSRPEAADDILRTGQPCAWLLPELDELAAAVRRFLLLNPAPTAGRPRNDLPLLAAELAGLVAEVITRPGEPPPSITSPDGPVLAVVAKALGYILGRDQPAPAVAQMIRRHRRKVGYTQKS